jgi:hypothetical protein
VDPHWFQCGSGSSEPNQCGFRPGSWSDFKVTKAFWKGRKSGGLFVNLVNLFASGSGSAFPIWIRIQNSQIIRIRLHNTAFNHLRWWLTRTLGLFSVTFCHGQNLLFMSRWEIFLSDSTVHCVQCTQRNSTELHHF